MASRPVPSGDVIVTGETLAIEFRDGGQTEHIEVTAGEADWSEPSDRPHRAVNIGRQAYEEITVYFDRHDAVPQPTAEPE
jgi:hypothetical protein